MDDLKTFIAAWDEAGDIAVILERGLTLPSADKVQAFLASLPPAEHDKIRTSLTHAMIALEEYSAHLVKELADTKAQMDQSARSTKASLTYMSTGANRNK